MSVLVKLAPQKERICSYQKSDLTKMLGMPFDRLAVCSLQMYPLSIPGYIIDQSQYKLMALFIHGKGPTRSIPTLV